LPKRTAATNAEWLVQRKWFARVTDQAYSGSTSVKYTWAANTADAGAEFWFRPAGLSLDEVWIRFYFRISAASELPPIQKLFLYRNPGTMGGLMLLKLGDMHGLSFDNNVTGGTMLVLNADITRDAWHSIEVHYRNQDAQTNAAFWYDNAPITRANGPDLWDSGITWLDGRLYLALAYQGTKITGFNACATRNGPQDHVGTLWMDRIAISSVGRIGP
jgi:hypothetical protein